ncbi:Glycosyltransferase, catalytic subunit of cellulose synthase and poly-beta-1,6-N-acetylglucosamine synthase [Granulicella rosea]|uniref:Glycosyltransferase, catalytic subunit of cellulose synthase and poly-beta-1,6-N-acetylglucosamine synthase n=1 Tax=Granulicella rosea TaxID=474952 RepID=A0A239EUZ0_9BACT|nr:glycosyltransferase family 2 protein [Granulicella rosea]SNS47654.1 Glycosyltransferase, catalytic subunit of cellulose synthase and poly-beta-1,6-N-acetylglucosamine synthase [Granulicella rosea]
MTAPLAVELLVLSFAAALPVPARRTGDGSGLRLFAVVPAHNEERLIAQCVRSILDNSPAGVEVVVVAHNCIDATAANAQAAGATVLTLNGEGGKGVALNHAFGYARNAGADAVLVIDADSAVSPNLTSAVLARLGAGARALQCRYQVANVHATTRTRLMALAFLGMNILRPRGRDRLGLSCGIFGNGFALTLETLARVPYAANSVVEDLEYHLHLIRAGIRVEFVDQATVFGEMPETKQGATTQRARWEGGRILMRRQWRGPLTVQVLQGRWRMLEPLLDLLALPLATQVMLLIAAVILPVGWARTYGLIGLAATVAYMLVAAFLGPEPGQTLRALASAPGYMVWKLMMIPKTRAASRQNAAWVRTKRNIEVESKKSGA